MSQRYPGGLITKTPVTPNVWTAPGIWTLDQAIQYQKAGTWPLATDQYFNQTTLLLHGDGTNGAQNNTFLDSSTNNFTITRNGNTTQGTFSPFSLAEGEWSNYFTAASSGLYNASGSNTTIHPSASFLSAASGSRVGSIEAMVYCQAYPTAPSAGEFSAIVNFGGNYFNFGVNSSGELSLYYYSGAAAYTESTASSKVPLNQWVYVAAIFDSSNTVKLYVNGVEEDSATFNGVGYASGNNTINQLRIGRTYTGSTSIFQGYISNVRIVNGTAITPSTPTAPLYAITNTSILTCQSNRFVDNSASPYTLTIEGTPSIQPFSPFAPSAAYSTSVNGGSGYFDGSGDYLTAPDDAAFDLGSGAFTIECFVYLKARAANYDFFVGQWNNSSDAWLLFSQGNTLQFWANGVSVKSETVTITLNQWYHFACTRDGSNNLRLYANGVKLGSDTAYSTTIINGTANPTIGTRGDGLAGTNINGYMTSVRVLKGAAEYTGSTYTIPTAPETSDANTSLLLNFSNAGIFDNTGKNNLETIADCAINTTTKKYGTGSMEFDGTGDYLKAVSNPQFILSGDFTIEAWAYPNNTAANFVVICLGDSYTSTGLELYAGSAVLDWRVFSDNASKIDSSTAYASGSWVYLAVVRSSGVVTLYVNGTAEGSTWSTTATFSGNLLVAGELYNGSTSSPTNGYIDDLRITKGVARYTANFTPPGGPFQNL